MTKTSRRPHKGRRFGILVLLLVAFCCFFWTQQNLLQHQTIPIALPNLPTSFDGLRIMIISDLHSKEFGENNETLLKAVATQNPDIIAITGDLIDRNRSLDMVGPVGAGLVAIAPTYYVTGNHEWSGQRANSVKKILSAQGVTVLSNEFIPLERDGELLILAGIEDPNGPLDQKSPTQLGEEIAATYPNAPIVLLAHRNEKINDYMALGADVTLCGHAHGGVIRLPFTDGLIDSGLNLFPTHTAGAYDLSAGKLVVSRGLGNSGSSFRLFNRPHLPLVVLEKGD